jgi:hypothetical protein
MTRNRFLRGLAVVATFSLLAAAAAAATRSGGGTSTAPADPPTSWHAPALPYSDGFDPSMETLFEMYLNIERDCSFGSNEEAVAKIRRLRGRYRKCVDEPRSRW